MKIVDLEKMDTRGWFVGKFPEAAIYREDFELCITTWPSGPVATHYHTSSTEAIVILNGGCIINGQTVRTNEMFIIEPGDINDSNYTEETKILAIKFPAGYHDKVLI